MRRSALLLLTALSGAPAAVPTEPYVWRNVTIVAGGFMPGIVFHPTARGVAYARSDMGGGYRLDPATRRWVPLMDFTRTYVETGVESIALDPRDPERVYFACGTTTADWAPNGFLLRSTDRGAHWERITLPFKCGGNSDGRSIGERLAVDPLDGRRLWFGSRQRGLQRSDDRGSTWQPVTSFPVTDPPAGPWPNIGVGFVLADPRGSAPGGPTRTLYAGVAAKPDSLFRSTDGGATWAAVPGQPQGWLPHHGVLAANGMLYVTYCDAPGPNGVSDSRVWKLDTASGAWTDITPCPPAAGQRLGFGYAGLAVDPQAPDTLMVSTTCRWWPGDEQWRSTDGGATWTAVGPTAERDPSASPFLRWGRPATVKVGAGNWEGSIAIDPFDRDRVLYVTGATVWGCDDVTNLDHGRPTHWVVRGEGIEQTAVNDLISPPEGPPLLSGIGDIGGFTHDDLTTSPAGMMAPYLINTSLDYAGQAPSMIVRVGHGQKLIPGARSSDGGHTWTPFVAEPSPGAKNGTVAVTADGATILWAPEGQPPFRSVDGGATWQAVAGVPGSSSVTTDRVDPRRCYAVRTTRQGNTESSAVYRSEDGGATFTPGATGLTGRRVRAVPGYAGHLWLAGPDGLRRSTDGGRTFTRLPAVTSALSVGFGRAAPGRDHPAVFLAGTIDGVEGLFRSDDVGVSWVRINDDQHRWGGIYGPLTGDPRVYGRFYLGTNGRGIIWGERATVPGGFRRPGP